jgi:hypothetical protein
MRKALLVFLNFVLVIGPAILAGLPFMERVPGEPLPIRWEIWNYVYDGRLTWTVSIAVIIGLGTLAKEFLAKSDSIAKHIRQTVMAAMLDECFPDDKPNIRISIFRDAGFFRNRWIFIKKLFTTKTGWKTIRHKYVYVWDRLGKPKSKTYFRYESKSETLCRGVAGVARFQESDVLVLDLPDIKNITLQTLNITAKSKEAKKVRRYLKEGYIDFETLKKLNRISRHLYGNVLTDEKGAFKRVLVIDSCADNSPFNDFVLQNIPYYLKILASTI